MAAIRHADIDDDRRFLLAKLVEIYVELNEAETERYRAELTKQDNEEVREMVITWEETLAAREARGEARGLVASIMRVLNRRLGSAPAFVRQKLDAIDSLERLEEVLDQALTVSSVDELVFEEEPSN